jgi:hypothetical protein
LKSKHGESLRRAANDRLHDNIEQVMRDKEELECKLIGFSIRIIMMEAKPQTRASIRIIMMEAQASDSSLNKKIMMETQASSLILRIMEARAFSLIIMRLEPQ